MMFAMQRRVGLAAFAVLAIAAVSTACTGSSAAPNLSTATLPTSAPGTSHQSQPPTPTPTLTYPADVPLTGHNVRPGEKPPVYPEAANTKTQEGANAFAEFFMKTLDWAYATTNPSYMKHYYAASCGLCAGIATGIAKTAAQKHWYMGGRLTVRSVKAAPIAEVTAESDFCTSVTLDIPATTVVDGTGKIITGQGALTNQTFKLCDYLQSGSWRSTYLIGTS